MRADAGRPFGAVLVLAVQNLAVFWSHYFRGVGFPWDFSQAYFAMSSFSVRALEHGLLPQWLPFQCMGYPYALNLQSGLYYPPLWFFALFHLPYDLRAATILQCLHVLLGAIGMYVLVHRLFRSEAYALAGAAMFQLFGGFYSNAEHPDIVRSFAFVPWLFFAFTFRDGHRLPGKAQLVLLPLAVFFAATGGYPGNLVATLFLLGVYVAAQVTDALARRHAPSRVALVTLSILGLLVLGLGLAAVHLGPPWIDRTYMARLGAHFRYRSLWLEHLPLLFYSSRPLQEEPSMTSTFLTIPGVLLAFFISGKGLRERWPWLVVLGTSILMVAGDRSFLWKALTASVGAFRLSRFPSSDYRPLIALALVVIAASGFRSLDRKEIGARSFAVRSALAFAAVGIAGRALYGAWLAPRVVLGSAVAIAAVVVFVWIRTASEPRGRAAAVACLVALIALDAWRVLPDMITWKEPDIASLYQRRKWVHPTTEERKASMFEAAPASRPAREETEHPHWYSWAGYLEGRYMIADKAPCILRSAVLVFEKPLYKDFMSLPWTSLDLAPPARTSEIARLTVADDRLGKALARAVRRPAGIRQTRYGMDQISYRVSLPRETLVVENEIYFPGWEATLGPPGRRSVRAVEVDGVFRGWLLPAGDYAMVARFRLPHLGAFRLVSLTSLALWLVVLGLGLTVEARRSHAGARPRKAGHSGSG